MARKLTPAEQQNVQQAKSAANLFSWILIVVSVVLVAAIFIK